MGWGSDLSLFAEQTAQRTLARLGGLGDEEFRWQPASDAWTVRTLRSGRTIVDNNVYQPGPAPVTSIAWRVAHLIDVSTASPADDIATVHEAAAAGRWDLVEALTLDGVEVNGGDPSAVHLAAVLGDLELVRLLVEHGADLRAEDSTYNGTPRFWADFFGRNEIVAYLRAQGSAEGQTEATS